MCIFKSLKLNKIKNVLGNNLELKIKKQQKFDSNPEPSASLASDILHLYATPLHSNSSAVARCRYMRWCSVNFFGAKKLKFGVKMVEFLDGVS
jgi:hypothetical protein